jgi:hypothetical protein
VVGLFLGTFEAKNLVQLGRLQTVDLLYLQSLLNYLQVTLVTLNIIQSLVNVLLVP